MYFNLLSPTTSLQVPLGTLRSQLISPWVQLALPICAWVWSLVCTWPDWPTFPACMFSLIPSLVYYYYWTGRRFLLFLLVFWFAYKERGFTVTFSHLRTATLSSNEPLCRFSPFLLPFLVGLLPFSKHSWKREGADCLLPTEKNTFAVLITYPLFSDQLPLLSVCFSYKMETLDCLWEFTSYTYLYLRV